jgi:hypothetical protein
MMIPTTVTSVDSRLHSVSVAAEWGWDVVVRPAVVL